MVDYAADVANSTKPLKPESSEKPRKPDTGYVDEHYGDTIHGSPFKDFRKYDKYEKTHPAWNMPSGHGWSFKPVIIKK
jgi:hypothetical protein